MVKPLDDLLHNEAYFGLEDNKHINTGLGFGARKGNAVVERMLKDYSNMKFVLEDGSLNLVTCPVRNTASIATLLPERIGEDIIDIGVARLYPLEYFCPLEPSGVEFRKTENTYSVHWFSASWLSDEEMIVHEWKIFRGKCEKRLGKKVGSLLARVVYLFLPQKRNVLKKRS